MRLTVPITGKAIRYSDGRFEGDPNDPVRIAIDIGDICWKAVSFDLDNSTAIIEADVQPQKLIKLAAQPARFWEDLSVAEKAQVSIGAIVVDNSMIVEPKPAEAQARRTKVLNATQQLLEGNTIDELLAMSGLPKLIVLEQ